MQPVILFMGISDFLAGLLYLLSGSNPATKSIILFFAAIIVIKGFLSIKTMNPLIMALGIFDFVFGILLFFALNFLIGKQIIVPFSFIAIIKGVYSSFTSLLGG